MSSYRIVVDVTDGERSHVSASTAREIVSVVESSARVRGVLVDVVILGAGGQPVQPYSRLPKSGPARPAGHWEWVEESPARSDPPMGYGYRQLHADPSQVYALRWGQSGRITGYANAGRENGVSGIPDPSTLVYIEHVESIAWARAQRWEVVAP